MSVGAGEGGWGERRGSQAAETAGRPEEDPPSGLRGSGGPGSVFAREAAATCVGGRASWHPRRGGMDLEASLLPTGPNASNTSESPDNLTAAGETRWRAVFPPLRRRGWETGRFHLRAKLLAKLYASSWE